MRGLQRFIWPIAQPPYVTFSTARSTSSGETTELFESSQRELTADKNGHIESPRHAVVRCQCHCCCATDFAPEAGPNPELSLFRPQTSPKVTKPIAK